MNAMTLENVARGTFFAVSYSPNRTTVRPSTVLALFVVERDALEYADKWNKATGEETHFITKLED